MEACYRQVKRDRDTNLLPLQLDLVNPSPSIGFANDERPSILQRGPADLVLALGLVHHLAISNNLPLAEIADFLSRISDRLLIEFVPKEDSQVGRLLQNREDVFPDYHQAGFETSFSKYFSIVKRQQINGTRRTLYLMRKKAA